MRRRSRPGRTLLQTRQWVKSVAEFRDQNDRSRVRLQELLLRLTPERLQLSVGGGWTVRAALVHLAFWDRFAATLVNEWHREGFRAHVHDAEHINLVCLPDWLAAGDEYAIAEVLRAATAADARAVSTAEPLRRTIEQAGEGWLLQRHVHRAEHLDEVTRLLGHGV